MKIETLIDLLEKGGFGAGFDAVLSESNNKNLTKRVRSVSRGMDVNVLFYSSPEGIVARFRYGGDCVECALDEKQQQTGSLQDADIRDFGMSLLLRDGEYFYILNMEKALTLP